MPSKSLWRRRLCGSLAVLWLVIGMGPAMARAGEGEAREPTPGQAGKDVIWLPSDQKLVDQMLDLAKVTPDDVVIDLGSGDGRIVITAAKRGAQALGIEYDSNLVAVSQRNALRAGVADKARFVQGDIFEKDFSPATVLTMFLMPNLNLRLRPKILDLKPGTRIVSNTFDMADWPPDQRKELLCDNGREHYACDILFWIVPARVEGRWRLPQGELQLEQTFQFLTGTLKSGDEVAPLSDGRIAGNRISFRVGEVIYSGELAGDILRGTLGGSRSGDWAAQQMVR